jgi:hypothetical protein
VSAVLGLVVNLGWLLLWLGGVGVAVWQIVRGRAVAGALIGLGSVGGLLLRLAPALVDLAMPFVTDVVGVQLAFGLRAVLFGVGHAVVLALLIGGAAVQRPPKAA